MTYFYKKSTVSGRTENFQRLIFPLTDPMSTGVEVSKSRKTSRTVPV